MISKNYTATRSAVEKRKTKPKRSYKTLETPSRSLTDNTAGRIRPIPATSVQEDEHIAERSGRFVGLVLKKSSYRFLGAFLLTPGIECLYYYRFQ